MTPAGVAPGEAPDVRSRFRWTSASLSHVGLVREVNEDAYLDQPEPGLWAIADGMGGHTVGDFASRRVIEALSDVRSPVSLQSFVADARVRLHAVNQHLRAEAAIRNVRVIGSTVVVLLACDGYCACLWAGDSRVYLYRNGRLRQLTRDHSQWEELKAHGHLIVDDEIRQYARHAVTRAVGALDTLDLDEAVVEVVDGDIFLLCSDGLTNTVSEREIRNALLPGNCRRASEALVELALQGGGPDNISAVVVRAEDLNGDRTMLNPAL